MNIARWAPLLPALMLAACHGAPVPPPQATAPPPYPGVRQGIDLASDTSDVMNELKSGRLDFVARYYRDPDSHWPSLSAGEAQLLASQGLKIVAVWEWHSPDPTHFQYYYGYTDATMAHAQAKAVGQPSGTPIYFAVDANVHPDTMASVAWYFRGIAAGLAAAGGGRAEYKVGVYGSGAVCDAVKGSGLAQYSWLSSALAWDGADYDKWDIRQGERMPELSFNQDSDEAKEDYGGFQPVAPGEAAAYAPGPGGTAAIPARRS